MQSLVLLVLVGYVVAFSLDPRPTRSGGVRGVLMCGGQPAAGVQVKLYDGGVVFDSNLAEGKTDGQGRFELIGHKSEISNLDLKVNIYHNCDNKGFSLGIPSSYVSRGKTPEKIFDVGVIQLEAKQGKESHDCIH